MLEGLNKAICKQCKWYSLTGKKKEFCLVQYFKAHERTGVWCGENQLLLLRGNSWSIKNPPEDCPYHLEHIMESQES
jgi:hypothetical protein